MRGAGKTAPWGCGVRGLRTTATGWAPTRVRSLALALGVIAIVAVTLTGCDSPWASTKEPPPDVADFALVDMPVDADVQFTGDAVVWLVRTVEPDVGGSWGVSDVMSHDVASGETGRDEWLSTLFATHAVSEWVLTGDRVSWIDTSERNGAPDGTVYVGTVVETALRGEPIGTPLAPAAWGVSGDTGGYEPAAFGLHSDGSLVTWYGSRSELSRDWSRLTVTDPLRLTVWDSTDGSLDRLAGPGAEEFMTVGGRRVFTAVNGEAVTGEPVERTIGVWEADSGRTWTVHGGAALRPQADADESWLVYSVPPGLDVGSSDYDLAGLDVKRDVVFLPAGGPGTQSRPAVDDDLIVWVDTPPRHRDGGSPSARVPSTLQGLDLDSGALSALVAKDITAQWADAEFESVTLLGTRLFWTIRHDGVTTAYGGRVVRDDGLTLEPLR